MLVTSHVFIEQHFPACALCVQCVVFVTCSWFDVFEFWNEPGDCLGILLAVCSQLPQSHNTIMTGAMSTANWATKHHSRYSMRDNDNVKNYVDNNKRMRKSIFFPSHSKNAPVVDHGSQQQQQHTGGALRRECDTRMDKGHNQTAQKLFWHEILNEWMKQKLREQIADNLKLRFFLSTCRAVWTTMYTFCRQRKLWIIYFRSAFFSILADHQNYDQRIRQR